MKRLLVSLLLSYFIYALLGCDGPRFIRENEQPPSVTEILGQWTIHKDYVSRMARYGLPATTNSSLSLEFEGTFIAQNFPLKPFYGIAPTSQARLYTGTGRWQLRKIGTIYDLTLAIDSGDLKGSHSISFLKDDSTLLLASVLGNGDLDQWIAFLKER